MKTSYNDFSIYLEKNNFEFYNALSKCCEISYRWRDFEDAIPSFCIKGLTKDNKEFIGVENNNVLGSILSNGFDNVINLKNEINN